MHVQGQVRGGSVEATFIAKIIGTDPDIGDIRAELGDDTMRRIANVESGFHQFERDSGTGRIVPKFNFKTNPQGQRVRGDGGAGICQITPRRRQTRFGIGKRMFEKGNRFLEARAELLPPTLASTRRTASLQTTGAWRTRKRFDVKRSKTLTEAISGSGTLLPTVGTPVLPTTMLI